MIDQDIERTEKRAVGGEVPVVSGMGKNLMRDTKAGKYWLDTTGPFSRHFRHSGPLKHPLCHPGRWCWGAERHVI